MDNPRFEEAPRAKSLGWIAAVLGTAAFAAMILTAGTEISTRRDAYRLALSYYAFYLPGLCAAAAGLATGLVARPLGRKEGHARREAVIGIILSVLALVGLTVVRLGASWFVGDAR